MKARVIKFRRKFKGIFFSLKLHTLTPSNFLITLGNMGKVSKWINQNKKKGLMNDLYVGKINYDKRFELHTKISEYENLSKNPIDFLEFGVSRGTSFKWWVEHNSNPDSSFHGFDTFTGLPEDWGVLKKGSMSNGNEPPKIDDKRVNFYQGLFQQTFPEFIEKYNSENRKVIHLDADLYTSTLFVLTSFSHKLKKGDIILFDEFNVPMHEFKAFSEWVEAFYINYEFLGGVNNNYQIGIKIL